MEETDRNSKLLWKYVKETPSLDKLNKKSAQLGVRDQINQKFCKKLFAYQEQRVALLESSQALPDD
jgi:hypothetical protein